MPDIGTPELVAKRALGLTEEALDSCLRQGLLTPQQHWCGIHLRWLHTLRYGAPGVRAVDPTHLGGMETCPEHPAWRAAREAEYHQAIQRLGNRYTRKLLAVAVYNVPPACFHMPDPHMPAEELTVWERKAREEILDLQAGFSQLVDLWCYSKKRLNYALTLEKC